MRDGLNEFRATSMDDLLNHLKAINDYRCNHQKMPYIEYMTDKYKHGEHQGLHNMPDSWASDVLQKHCNAMINLFQGRPLSRADMTAQAASAEAMTSDIL